jgi:hypothetical protein
VAALSANGKIQEAREVARTIPAVVLRPEERELIQQHLIWR